MHRTLPRCYQKLERCRVLLEQHISKKLESTTSLEPHFVVDYFGTRAKIEKNSLYRYTDIRRYILDSKTNQNFEVDTI